MRKCSTSKNIIADNSKRAANGRWKPVGCQSVLHSKYFPVVRPTPLVGMLNWIHSAAGDWVACLTATPIPSAAGGQLRASRYCVAFKLNSMPMPPIGLAVTNTADAVIVNYVRDFLHFIPKCKSKRKPKLPCKASCGKTNWVIGTRTDSSSFYVTRFYAISYLQLHVAEHNLNKWWTHGFNNFFSDTHLLTFVALLQNARGWRWWKPGGSIRKNKYIENKKKSWLT